MLFAHRTLLVLPQLTITFTFTFCELLTEAIEMVLCVHTGCLSQAVLIIMLRFNLSKRYIEWLLHLRSGQAIFFRREKQRYLSSITSLESRRRYFVTFCYFFLLICEEVARYVLLRMLSGFFFRDKGHVS